MKKLKIAFIVPVFPVPTETFIVNQMIDQIERGHQIVIFAFAERRESIIHQNIYDYNLLEKVIYWNEKKISKLKRLIFFLRFLILNRRRIEYKRITRIFDFRIYGKKALNLENYTKYKWILDHAPFDLIHNHFGVNSSYITVMKTFGYFGRTGFINSFHGYDIPKKSSSTDEKRYKVFFEEVDLVTVNSFYSKTLLRKLTLSKKIRILPVGLDTQLFKKMKSTSSRGFTLIFVGRLVKIKGPLLLIDIFDRLIKKGYTNLNLRIIGKGELEEDLVDYIKKLNLQSKVELTGELSQEEVIKKMDDSHIFLLPGISDDNGRGETQGLVIQEAQAMNLPVVISDAGGMKAGVIDGETGFVVKEKDIEGFVEKIVLLIKNEKLRREMGKNGRNFVIRNFDTHVLGDKLESLYFEVLCKLK